MHRNGLHADDVDRAAGQLMDLCLTDLYRRRLWNVSGQATADEIKSNVDHAVKTFVAAYREPV
jgi:hypothetical protein